MKLIYKNFQVKILNPNIFISSISALCSLQDLNYSLSIHSWKDHWVTCVVGFENWYCSFQEQNSDPHRTFEGNPGDQIMICKETVINIQVWLGSLIIKLWWTSSAHMLTKGVSLLAVNYVVITLLNFFYYYFLSFFRKYFLHSFF